MKPEDTWVECSYCAGEGVLRYTYTDDPEEESMEETLCDVCEGDGWFWAEDQE